MDRRKKIIVASLVSIALFGGVFASIKLKAARAKEAATSIIDKKSLNQFLTVTGNIEAKDKYEITLNSNQKVVSVYHKEGAIVKSGDILVKLDTAELEAQLHKAQATMDIAKINLNKLLESSSRSETKAVGNSVEQAQIALEDANRNYEDAKNKFSSNETLYQGGYISKDEYNNSKKLLSESENKVRSAELALTNAKNSLADVPVNRNEQIALQKKQIESTAADIENIKRKIDESSIKSTIDGTVVKLSVKENQYPTSENALVQVCDLSAYKAKIQVNQNDAISMAVGQKSSVRTKGLNKKYSGTVTSVGQMADITLNGTNKESKVNVEVAIDNPDNDIKVGYEADVDISLNQKADTLSVNFEAVKTEKSGKKYVFIIEGGKAKKRYIKTGVETGVETEIVDGLKKGEKYISNPSEDLREGDPIKVTKKGGE